MAHRAHKRWLALFSVLWLMLLAVFYSFPAIDIAVSEFFFTPDLCSPDKPAGVICGIFAVGSSPVLQTVRTVLFYLPGAVLAAFIIWLIHSQLTDRTAPAAAYRHNVVLLCVSWLLDVILVVNLVLKAYSGRPRPDETTLFSGLNPFVPAGDISGACAANCSFISGEAASAGWLVCALFVLPVRLRRWLSIPVTLLAVGTAFLRVAFGRHFLSDALLGFLSAPVVFLFLIAIFGWKKTGDEPG